MFPGATSFSGTRSPRRARSSATSSPSRAGHENAPSADERRRGARLCQRDDGGVCGRAERAPARERGGGTGAGRGLGRPGVPRWARGARELDLCRGGWEGERVGILWLGAPDARDTGVLWVLDVEIEPRHRGRGLGRDAMRLAEAEAQRLGYGRIKLNVFASNLVARALYRSLGYEEMSLQLTKEVGP
ncbi:MAG TPA: GNAT family N-acetyltransferase [Gaiellales bacterium]|nr:GNAT family N-acetyltransferase [Gaiellales bacterium]